jgi:hypothetical protein
VRLNILQLSVNICGFFLISNFPHVLNVVCFLLGNSPASEVYMPTFRNTLSVPSSQAGRDEESSYLFAYVPSYLKPSNFTF